MDSHIFHNYFSKILYNKKDGDFQFLSRYYEQKITEPIQLEDIGKPDRIAMIKFYMKYCNEYQELGMNPKIKNITKFMFDFNSKEDDAKMIIKNKYNLYLEETDINVFKRIDGGENNNSIFEDEVIFYWKVFIKGIYENTKLTITDFIDLKFKRFDYVIYEKDLTLKVTARCICRVKLKYIHHIISTVNLKKFNNQPVMLRVGNCCINRFITKTIQCVICHIPLTDDNVFKLKHIKTNNICVTDTSFIHCKDCHFESLKKQCANCDILVNDENKLKYIQLKKSHKSLKPVCVKCYIINKWDEIAFKIFEQNIIILKNNQHNIKNAFIVKFKQERQIRRYCGCKCSSEDIELFHYANTCFYERVITPNLKSVIIIKDVKERLHNQ